MLNQKMKPIAAAVGTAFVASLASASVTAADDSLFVAEDLERGYDLLAQAEGKCGEGKCGEGKGGGEAKKESKAGEGKCGAQGKAQKEGKCGDGKWPMF